MNALVIRKLPPNEAPPEYQRRRIHSIWYLFVANRILLFCWVVMFVIGIIWSFEALAASSCPTSAPFLFRMCFSIVVMQLVLVGVFLLFTCCACLMTGLRIFVYIPGDSSNTSRGATETMIRSLKWRKFKEGILPKEDASCAICLCDYEISEHIRFLPCHHHFHAGCVDQWLLTNKACPLCKQEIQKI